MLSSVQLEEQDEREAEVALSNGPRVLARMPDRALLNCIKHTKLRDWAQTYDPVEQGGALLVGPTSIGKTAACVYAVKRLVKGHRAELRKDCAQQGVRARLKGLSVEWVRAVDLANARLQHELGDGEAPMMVKCHNAALLVVDDAGWESKSDTIAQVLSVRYDRGLPTVVTSNYTDSELVARYGAPFVRRLLEYRGQEGKILDCWRDA